MGKLLIVSWTLHPWPTGSSVIVNNIASQFSQDELVLYGEKYPNLDNREWDSNYPNIIYADPRFTVNDKGYRYLKWLSTFRLIRELKKIVKSEGVSKILCIYPNEHYMYVCYKVSKALGIPMYSWFHNTYLDNVTGLFRKLATVLQPKFFSHCQVNFVMSDGMRNYYKEAYPNITFRTLVHGFPLPANTGISEVEHLDEKRTFLFVGSLNESCRDATIRLIGTILKNPNYVVHAYTSAGPEEFSKYGVKGTNFEVRGFVPLQELYKIQRGYDVMLLPHGFDGDRTEVEYNTIFPTRTIPMLVSGRPILCHSPKGAFLTSFIGQNKCGIIVDEKSEEKINHAILELIEDSNKVDRIVANAWKSSEIFRLQRVVTNLKSLI